MNVKELRRKTGLSQAKFAAKFGIPAGSLRNWEQGIASPPTYVLTMMEQILEGDKMINVATIKFIKMLDELAEKTNIGIEPFSAISPKLFEKVVCYDDCNRDPSGEYPVVKSAELDSSRREIISCYDTPEYTVRVVEGKGKNREKHIVVYLFQTDAYIQIKNGAWNIL